MTELLIIKTENSQEIRKFLESKHIGYEVYLEPSRNVLREYIKKKKGENIFADYNKALKNKELEAEKTLIENDYGEEDEGGWWEWKKETYAGK
jgi:hypothetical protein